jgi:mono/diheme cytochrome c family protein
MPVLKRVVKVAELVALACVVTFVVLLFAHEPARPAASFGPYGGGDQGPALYRQFCASCHGAGGGGGVGPRLGGGAVVRRYPKVADQVQVVTEGRGSMPAWRGTLTTAQIRAVVNFERAGLR